MIKDFKTYIEEGRLARNLETSFSEKERSDERPENSKPFGYDENEDICVNIAHDNMYDYVSECEVDGNELYADEDSFIEFCMDKLDSEKMQSYFRYYVINNWDDLYSEMEEKLH